MSVYLNVGSCAWVLVWWQVKWCKRPVLSERHGVHKAMACSLQRDTTYTGRLDDGPVHRMFSYQLLLVFIAPTHRGMARLSWPEWLVTSGDDAVGQAGCSDVNWLVGESLKWYGTLPAVASSVKDCTWWFVWRECDDNCRLWLCSLSSELCSLWLYALWLSAASSHLRLHFPWFYSLSSLSTRVQSIIICARLSNRNKFCGFIQGWVSAALVVIFFTSL